MCKVSKALSQRAIQEKLEAFVSSDTHEVILFIADMQAISIRTINHLRMMIEHAESEKRCNLMPKLFALLLHFPPRMFFSACYPSLFLSGWEHCYLDSISHGVTVGTVDIKEWFSTCCSSPTTNQPNTTDKDTLLLLFKYFFPQTIATVVSRVAFGLDNKRLRPFNHEMTPLERSQAIKQLSDTDIGMKLIHILCQRFRSYWCPEVMTEYLHRAVSFAQRGETGLNISDSIQSIIFSHFLDFLVFMFSQMNENYNLDILFEPNSPKSQVAKEVYLEITSVLPIPQKLSKLKLVSSIQQDHLNVGTVVGNYKFPYYNLVSNGIAEIVKAECVKLIGQSVDLRDTQRRIPQHPKGSQFEEKVLQATRERLVEEMNVSSLLN